MKKVHACLLLLGLLVALAGCGPGGTARSNWTFLVYMAADNNLDYFAALDLAEMAAVGSTSQVKVVVQRDPATPGATTKRLLIVRGAQTTVSEMAETDTGQEDVLLDFLVWGVQSYPADRYALVLWNHGSGVYDPPATRSPLTAAGGGMQAQAVAFDEGAGGNALTTQEYSSAIRRAEAEAGFHLDVLLFDACLMQMAEVGAELVTDSGTPSVGYLVGSEANIPGPGFDYTRLLGWLAANGTADGSAMAVAAVDAFHQTYAPTGQDTMLSAVDLTGLPWQGLLTDLRDLAAAVIAADEATVGRVRDQAVAARLFDPHYPENKDLGEFAGRLAENLADRPAIAGPAARIADRLSRDDGPILAVGSTGSYDDGRTHGLALCIPTTTTLLGYYPYYGELRLSVVTAWDEAATAIAQA